VVPYPDQPFQGGYLPYYGCDVGQANLYADTAPTPNGVEADSIANDLIHELAETFTNPVGQSWMTANSQVLVGSEIGDVCDDPSGQFTPYRVDGVLYYIQPLYSNRVHACVLTP